MAHRIVQWLSNNKLKCPEPATSGPVEGSSLRKAFMCFHPESPDHPARVEVIFASKNSGIEPVSIDLEVEEGGPIHFQNHRTKVSRRDRPMAGKNLRLFEDYGLGAWETAGRIDERLILTRNGNRVATISALVTFKGHAPVAVCVEALL